MKDETGTTRVSDDGTLHAEHRTTDSPDAKVTQIAGNRQAEVRLRRLAGHGHDSLTRLPNRNLIYDLLESATQRAQRNRQLAAVLFLDVDGFREINNSVGHYEADLILCRLAGRLKSCLRKSDVVGRYGGDEFVLIVEALDDRDGVFPVLRNILAAFAQPVSTGQGELRLTCCIGIAFSPTDATDAGALVRKADAAMYQAKSNGRNGYRFSDPWSRT